MKIASITHCSALKAIPSQIAPNGMSGGQASIASDWLSKVEKVYKDKFQSQLKELQEGRSLSFEDFEREMLVLVHVSLIEKCRVDYLCQLDSRTLPQAT